MEEAISYFSVFGGLGWEIDTDVALDILIEEIILDNYGHLYNQIAEITFGDALYHSILTGIALGDRRIHSAFKRAHVSESVGEEAVAYLVECGMITIEHSREVPPQKAYPNQKLKKEIQQHTISNKLNFTSPFLRFWFSFIAPQAHNIQKGDYKVLFQNFKNREDNYSSLLFERLSEALLKKLWCEERIVEMSSYWDRHVEIDILAKTASGKIVAGECKYTNTKVNKKELTKLKEKCQLISMEPTCYLLFSKRGFSHELESLQSHQLKLYSLDDFKLLLEDISIEEKIRGFALPTDIPSLSKY